MIETKPLYDWSPIILIGNMKDRSKRKYGFGDLTAPTKLECLELVEKEKEAGSARIAELMGIPLNHASKIMRDYWSQGLLHRELNTKRRRGVCYRFSLTNTGRNLHFV